MASVVRVPHETSALIACLKLTLEPFLISNLFSLWCTILGKIWLQISSISSLDNLTSLFILLAALGNLQQTLALPWLTNSLRNMLMLSTNPHSCLNLPCLVFVPSSMASVSKHCAQEIKKIQIQM